MARFKFIRSKRPRDEKLSKKMTNAVGVKEKTFVDNFKAGAPEMSFNITQNGFEDYSLKDKPTTSKTAIELNNGNAVVDAYKNVQVLESGVRSYLTPYENGGEVHINPESRRSNAEFVIRSFHDSKTEGKS